MIIVQDTKHFLPNPNAKITSVERAARMAFQKKAAAVAAGVKDVDESAVAEEEDKKGEKIKALKEDAPKEAYAHHDTLRKAKGENPSSGEISERAMNDDTSM